MRCSPITKATLRLEPGRIAESVSAAVALALSEPMGPVHLDLPEDVALAPATETVPPRPDRISLAPAADADVARAADLIAAAKRPVAVIGASAMRVTDPSLLRKLIERHGLPFATTLMAKGLIDEDHRLSLGCIERGCRQLQRTLLHSADLIVGIGYDTIEVEYEAWIGDVPLVQIDIEQPDIAPSVKLVQRVIGNLDASLAHLTAVAAATNRWTAQTLADHRRTFQQALRPTTNSFSAHAAIDAVRLHAARRRIVVRRRAHTHQIGSVDRARTQDVPDHQWLVVDGLWLAGRDRGEARAPRSAGGLLDRRRLLSNDVRRGRVCQAAWADTSDRRP
jgi:acetolactate synthase-1/2/3 large subunit